MAVGCFVSRLGEPPWVLQHSQRVCQDRLPKHNGGSLTHWEKTNTQFTNRLIFSTALATPPHSGPPAAYRRRPDPTFCTWFISIDGRHGFRPSSPRLRHRQTGKRHGGVHANSPGKRSSGKKSGSRCRRQGFTSSGRALFPWSSGRLSYRNRRRIEHQLGRRSRDWHDVRCQLDE